MNKNICLTGGGTAGHIYPALAVAELLKEEKCNIYFAGKSNSIEERLSAQSGLEFHGFGDISGFDRSKPTTAFSALYRLERAKKTACQWLQEKNISLVIGFGGYASTPACFAAKKLGITYMIHEQNSYMGKANVQLSKCASKICLTYREAEKFVADKSKIVITGNPVRREVLEATKEQGLNYLNTDNNSFVLTVFGGSLGAKSINNKIAELKDKFLSVDNLVIVHVTGKRDYEDIRNKLNLSDMEEKRYKLIDYCHEMAYVLAASDCIISRAGANSLAEISARKIPALIIPFPFATDNHQEKNAKSYVEAGAAYLIKDSEIGNPIFEKYLFDIIENPETREAMKLAASKFDTSRAAEKLCNEAMLLLK